jgi:hypothetical protein
VPPKAIAQSLAYTDSRLDVGSIYEMVDWYRGQRMIEKETDPAKADELLDLISRYTSVPPNAIAQSLAYIDSRLDVGSIYEMVEWYRGQRMIEKDTDPKTFIDLSFVEGHENIPAAMGVSP